MVTTGGVLEKKSLMAICEMVRFSALIILLMAAAMGLFIL